MCPRMLTLRQMFFFKFRLRTIRSFWVKLVVDGSKQYNDYSTCAHIVNKRTRNNSGLKAD